MQSAAQLVEPIRENRNGEYMDIEKLELENDADLEQR
jgi:hypothetical protein